VNVYVHTRLTARRAHIDANVVAVRRERTLNLALSLCEQFENGGLLMVGHIEEARNVALGYNKDVTTAQRVIVVPHVRDGILEDDTFESTQLADR